MTRCCAHELSRHDVVGAAPGRQKVICYDCRSEAEAAGTDPNEQDCWVGTDREIIAKLLGAA